MPDNQIWTSIAHLVKAKKFVTRRNVLRATSYSVHLHGALLDPPLTSAGPLTLASLIGLANFTLIKHLLTVGLNRKEIYGQKTTEL